MNKYCFVFLLFIGSLFADKSFDCGKSKADSRIIGGRAAKKGAHPWQASLIASLLFYNFCGGSLINEKWILTAAHCTKGMSANSIRVSLGSTKLDEKSSRVYKIARIINHPNYTKSAFVDDIALIELQNRVTFTDDVSPICLPNKDKKVFKNLVATGFGLTDRFGQQSTELMEVDLEQRDQQMCEKMYKEFNYKTTHICANSRGKDVCRGDSGGPLMTKSKGITYLAGIVSYGIVCGDYEKPSVFTRVSEYLDWIHQNIDNNEV